MTQMNMHRRVGIPFIHDVHRSMQNGSVSMLVSGDMHSSGRLCLHDDKRTISTVTKHEIATIGCHAFGSRLHRRQQSVGFIPNELHAMQVCRKNAAGRMIMM